MSQQMEPLPSFCIPASAEHALGSRKSGKSRQVRVSGARRKGQELKLVSWQELTQEIKELLHGTSRDKKKNLPWQANPVHLKSWRKQKWF